MTTIGAILLGMMIVLIPSASWALVFTYRHGISAALGLVGINWKDEKR
jgi:hypothetical protein